MVELFGRKVLFGTFCALLLGIGMLLPVSPAVYTAFTYGIIGVYAAMAGGNASEYLSSALGAIRNRSASVGTYTSEVDDDTTANFK